MKLYSYLSTVDIFSTVKHINEYLICIYTFISKTRLQTFLEKSHGIIQYSRHHNVIQNILLY